MSKRPSKKANEQRSSARIAMSPHAPKVPPELMLTEGGHVHRSDYDPSTRIPLVDFQLRGAAALFDFVKQRLHSHSVLSLCHIPEVADFLEQRGSIRRVPLAENGPKAWFPRLQEEREIEDVITDDILKQWIVGIQSRTGTKLAPGGNPWAYIDQYERYTEYRREERRKRILSGAASKDIANLPSFDRYLLAEGKESLLEGARVLERAPSTKRSRTHQREQKEAEAMVYLANDPGCSVAEIARGIGVPRTTLYGYRRFREVLRVRDQDAEERKAGFPTVSDLPESHRPNGDR